MFEQPEEGTVHRPNGMVDNPIMKNPIKELPKFFQGEVERFL
jgi:hypothetical protein